MKKSDTNDQIMQEILRGKNSTSPVIKESNILNLLTASRTTNWNSTPSRSQVVVNADPFVHCLRERVSAALVQSIWASPTEPRKQSYSLRERPRSTVSSSSRVKFNQRKALLQNDRWRASQRPALRE